MRRNTANFRLTQLRSAATSRSAPRRLQLAATLLACLFLAYTAGFGACRLWHEFEQARRPHPIEVFWEAWDRLEEHFYGELPSDRQRTYGAIRASLALLDDPHTTFLEPERGELERDELRGHYGGIGVLPQRDVQGHLILSPHPASAAQRAGVRQGDILLAVDGDPISAETSLPHVQARFHGQVGTPVTLTLSRPPAPPFDLTLPREEIQVSSITWRRFDGAPDIGYIRIQHFTERTDGEILTALQQLEQAGVTSLILDLRDCRGGLTASAVATAGRFLSDGVIVLHQLGRSGERVFKAENGGTATDMPLAVLVNRGAVTAAEIVAGALQDHGRAPLIGEPTFGSGSLQSIYDLADGASLHVTTALWLTPDGHYVQGQGLTPDIYVSDDYGPEDEQLDSAIDNLQSGTTSTRSN